MFVKYICKRFVKVLWNLVNKLTGLHIFKAFLSGPICQGGVGGMFNKSKNKLNIN